MIRVHQINVDTLDLKNYTREHVACLHMWAAILEI